MWLVDSELIEQCFSQFRLNMDKVQDLPETLQ